MRRTAEFDAFGPWVLRVRDEADVPPLFRAQKVDLDAALLVLKVPRNITRRDANPDMDLYDHLVVAGPDDVTLLSRRAHGPGYDEAHVRYDDVAWVRTSVELLDARLTVADARGGHGLSFTYSGSSDDEVEALAQLVRRRAVGPVAADDAHGPGRELQMHDLGTDDIGLVTAARALTSSEPGAAVLAAHGRRTVRRQGGRGSALLDALAPVTLHGLVVAASPGQVHLLHRRRWATTSRRPVHSMVRTTLLRAQVTGAAVTPAEAWIDVDQVTARMGGGSLAVPVPRGSDASGALTRLLRA
ncbi:hypothetical protein GXB85_13740 [Cellulomonas sp. APG4]|uniref:hypothetical protein n=1 Tax=Cellulomonas sp. APG4 TaxID=1538656 RepID=UPI00137ABB6E|nr:hypothetical protein [Cellulomonas sp. APG4]NCT92004.1 hypothetical protein [Cellulomonas sp. APG4]